MGRHSDTQGHNGQDAVGDDLVTEDGSERRDTEATSVARRSFLSRGGLVAGGAALGAVLAPTAAGAQVSAQAVDFIYLPVPPTRLYDSRQASGPLLNGFTRTLNTAFLTLDPVPIAVTFNMTVTQTRQKGWLALYPANHTFSGTSSINWFGDFQDLANNAYVEIPDDNLSTDGQIRVTCGGVAGAQADFVLDIIGLSAGFTIASAGAADVRNRLKDFAANRTPFTEG
jgi:hypothetical protein